MKTLLAALMLTGCAAHTTVYRDGKPLLVTRSDAQSLAFKDGATSLVIVGLDNSTPTTAQGKAIAARLDAIAAGLIGIAGSAIVR